MASEKGLLRDFQLRDIIIITGILSSITSSSSTVYFHMSHHHHHRNTFKCHIIIIIFTTSVPDVVGSAEKDSEGNLNAALKDVEKRRLWLRDAEEGFVEE